MTEEELRKRIAELPTGGISVKKIPNPKTGRVYEYYVYQWRENGKQKSRYLKEPELSLLQEQIAERKRLESFVPSGISVSAGKEGFATKVFWGESLKKIIQPVAEYKKRTVFSQLLAYLYGTGFGRVFILYGLRRTGKSTMIKQALLDMSKEDFERAALIQMRATDTLAELNRDLRKLMDANFHFVFIDEVTLAEDFIEGASLLSDVFAASGMKIVLSGTDSLAFWIAKSNELYDRCMFLHSTFIPYYEFVNVLGLGGIDTYIQYGGTMSFSGNKYNLFDNKEETDAYVDSAIAHNIQHSLQFYQDGGHFRHLYSLYEKGELTGDINRVVEDMNHRFTLQVLTRDFRSNDLAISKRNLRKETPILDIVNIPEITERLKYLLEIKNREEQTVSMDEIHVLQIEEYLAALDLTKKIPLIDFEAGGRPVEFRTVFTQAGLRYSQAKALIEVLMQDPVVLSLEYEERQKVTERILSEIRGRMLEDLVLLETTLARPDREVFKLQFTDGEFDMVVFDPKNGGCSIYEIKYSHIRDPHQYRHLTDEKKRHFTAFRYGGILETVVLYRGENAEENGVRYRNVEEYLLQLENA